MSEPKLVREAAPAKHQPVHREQVQDVRRALDACANVADIACRELEHSYKEFADLRKQALLEYAEGSLEIARIERSLEAPHAETPAPIDRACTCEKRRTRSGRR